MKKYLSVFIMVAMVLVSAKSYADLTFKKDSQNPPLKRVEILNIKTGGSGVITCLGEICSFDNTNLTGVNWQSLNALGVAGINWTGANISGTGTNWTSIRAYGSSFGGNTSGINWQAFGV